MVGGLKIKLQCLRCGGIAAHEVGSEQLTVAKLAERARSTGEKEDQLSQDIRHLGAERTGTDKPAAPRRDRVRHPLAPVPVLVEEDQGRPCAANRSAPAAPIPLAAPVMIPTRPRSRWSPGAAVPMTMA